VVTAHLAATERLQAHTAPQLLAATASSSRSTVARHPAVLGMALQLHQLARLGVRMGSSSRQRRLAVMAAAMPGVLLRAAMQLGVMVGQLVAAQHQVVLLLAALCGQRCRMIRDVRTTTTRRRA
jgi:hypothetical protein